MAKPRIVTRAEWLSERLNLLAKEKAHSRSRDELTRARQAMPWCKIDKHYQFQSKDGDETLLDLFAGKSQLIIYHFMFDTDWEEGCKSCSFIAEHYDPSVVHLANRDVSLVTVSIAEWQKLEAYKERMGWAFKWVSSAGSDFNRDFDVSFTAQERAENKTTYNFVEGRSFPVNEAPGISAFAKDEQGVVYHTYSAYARGLENFMPAYNLLDLVPKGRDEQGLAYGMEWLRHADRYEDDSFVDPYA
ncbi:MAG: DUF899 domain-containing protein [Pseudomonadota bacterium]